MIIVYVLFFIKKSKKMLKSHVSSFRFQLLTFNQNMGTITKDARKIRTLYKMFTIYLQLNFLNY